MICEKLNLSQSELDDLWRIMRWVCDPRGIGWGSFFNTKQKSRIIAQARRMFAVVARTRHGVSYPELAAVMGFADHSGALLRMRGVDEEQAYTWCQEYLSWLADEMTRTNAPGPQDSEHVHNRAPIPDEDKPAVPGAVDLAEAKGLA